MKAQTPFIMRYIVGILSIGFVLLVASLFMSPYTNEAEFRSKYGELTHKDSDKFYRLRNEYETSKYRIFDYGVSTVLAGLVCLAFQKLRRLRFSPSSIFPYGVMALLVPCLFCFGFVVDLTVAYGRGEFPHWGDSLGIPLSGVPFIFAALAIFSFGMLIFLPWRGLRQGSLKLAFKWPVSIPLALLAVLLGSATLLFLFLGQWWYWPSTAVALYQAVSLIASRKALV